MEEGGPGGAEPGELRCAEQAEVLSLIISGEEEATQADSEVGGKEKSCGMILSVCLAPRGQCAALSQTRHCQAAR